MAVATEKKCIARDIKVGDTFSRVSHGKVISIRPEIRVENENGFDWTLSPAIIEQEFYFVNQYHDEIALTRTELAAKISESTRINLTVNFNKKPEAKTLYETVRGLMDKAADGEVLTATKVRKTLKGASDGEERTMIGRHDGGKDEDGRIKFFDVEAKQPRLVDPRTVKWAIIANVKYVIKK